MRRYLLVSLVAAMLGMTLSCSKDYQGDYNSTMDAIGAAVALADGDYERARVLARPLAEKGDPRGQVTLGQIYFYGAGVKQDIQEGIRWYRKAAEQGYSPGQVLLAEAYAGGYGVTQDDAAAFRWYRKAATQRHANDQAVCKLGLLYRYGKGVRQDYKEAVNWLSKASSHQCAEALYELGELYQRGIGVQEDRIRGIVLMEISLLRFTDDQKDIKNRVATTVSGYRSNLSPEEVIQVQEGIQAWKDEYSVYYMWSAQAKAKQPEQPDGGADNEISSSAESK